MVAGEIPALDAAFHALAHPTRRAMLVMLADGERTIGELAEPFAVSLAASSKHVKVLEDANLVRRRVVGRTHACSLNAEPLRRVVNWTAAFRPLWEPAFARLDAVLEDLKSAAEHTPSDPTS